VPTTVVMSARYMTRFRCLAGDCEATCCGGGQIPVQESTHRRLTVLAAGDSEALALVESGIELTPGGPAFGKIRFLESGECTLRDEQGLCRVHKRFGHEALFEVCATYPRYASEVDDGLELFGTLACPEVSRLALLADDGFELAHLTLDEAPRVFRNRFRTDKPYFKPFKAVRGALVQLICEPSYALGEKLFVMLWMGDKLRPVLHAGAGEVSAAELDKALRALSDPQVLGALSASYRGLALDAALPTSVIVSLLVPPVEPRRGAQTEQFDAIWREMRDRYGEALAPGRSLSESDAAGVWARYRALRTGLPSWVRQRVDTCLTRYAMNHLLTTPYMLSANLFEYVYDLVVRVASLDFLLSSRLSAFTGAADELDRRIVEVVFSFVRTVEHADLPNELRKLLDQQGLNGLAHAVCFLALVSDGER
jgi:lysine-N-methylase